MNSVKVMISETPTLCLLVATLALGAEGIGCDHGLTWWDRERGICAPCTLCEPQNLAVKLPCALHRDTICQPLHDVHIYPFNTHHTETEQSVDEYFDYSDYEVSDSEVTDSYRWDVQTITLVLAASGCVLFFVVVLYLTFHHSKQWKALKQALRSDVQDLSAKLKLMEAGDPAAEPVVIPADHHIYCNVHVTKDAILGPASKQKGLGNVYTQEKHPT